MDTCTPGDEEEANDAAHDDPCPPNKGRAEVPVLHTAIFTDLQISFILVSQIIITFDT
jgi:hypothetical protein